MEPGLPAGDSPLNPPPTSAVSMYPIMPSIGPAPPGWATSTWTPSWFPV
jgi:hypothetical protein